MPRVAGVIGWPVRQSLSPAMHNEAFRARALDWVYLHLAVPPGEGARAVRLLRLLDAAGASVTMPHKRTVIEHLDDLGDDARTVDAVNTIVRDGERLVGRNTDGAGFVRFLRADAGVEPAGRRVLILGAGGAARAVAAALAAEGAAVRVAARRPGQAEEIAALAAGVATARWDDPGEADIVVNATPARAGLPLERLRFGVGCVAVDMIYPPPPTPFVEAARAAGAAAYGGLGMLLHQAALAFELWTGLQAPIERMRRVAGLAMGTQDPRPSG